VGDKSVRAGVSGAVTQRGSGNKASDLATAKTVVASEVDLRARLCGCRVSGGMPEVEMAIVLTVILVVLGGVLDGAAVVKDMEII
jgi:hypothetical protein